MEKPPLFFEKQYFRQCHVIGSLVLVNLFFVILFLQQVILGHPLGTKVAPNMVLGLLLVGSGLLTYFMVTAHLTTTISPQGITYQFIPFQRQVQWIAWQEVKTCYVRTYSPLKEYGGWGYKNDPTNSAYTVSGVVGIQLVLHSQRFILLGTAKAAQAQAVLTSLHEVVN